MDKITFIVATYNSGKTLERCLTSIVRQMDAGCELVVIDGGSKDNTINIVDLFKDKIHYCISEPDNGVYDAWNKAVRNSSGDWLVFIGSDDKLRDNAVTTYRHFFRENGHDYDLISARLNFVNKEGEVLRTVGEPWNWQKFVNRRLKFAHPGMLHNRRLFNQFGMFDTRYKICADSNFLQQAGRYARAGFIDEIIVDMSEGGMSDSYLAIKEGFLTRYRNKCIPVYSNLYYVVRAYIKYTGSLLKRRLK